jgi:phytanoyl-CoA hydroxylase
MKPIELTSSQIADYRELGFIKLGPVMSPELVDQFRDYLATLPPRPEDKGTLFFTQKRVVSPLLGELAARGPQVNVMNQLIGPNLRCWFDQFVVKPPGSANGVFPWHQDNGYNAPSPDNNITVWIALDQTTTENGCIWVVPASHMKGAIPHKRKSEDSWHIEVDIVGDGQAVPMMPGEAVAFTGYTLHRSKGNSTNKPRRAFFLEYCDADAKFADGTPINQKPAADLFAGGLSPVITGTSRFT